ncbi:hypothetical protein GGX14DRAFT_403043 [Mycena pura]|uniref:Uncharacterized protein n=1 Tax=Mycena pura TaxID=153505 RepID=A0AAD6V0U1_9AGAR|nr:hypothetical protein GGX14DRAFT_403043 [Mycena pura]
MAPTTNESIRAAQSTASALAEIAQSSHTPFLATTASVSLAVLQSLQSKRHELGQMVQDIHDILRAIVALELSTSTLNKLQSWLDNQRRTGKMRRLFRQNEETAQLEACKAGIKHVLDALHGSQLWSLFLAFGFATSIHGRNVELAKIVDILLDVHTNANLGNGDSPGSGSGYRQIPKTMLIACGLAHLREDLAIVASQYSP